MQGDGNQQYNTIKKITNIMMTDLSNYDMLYF